MSGREWKPGDVAMVNGDVCIRRSDGVWEHGDSGRWAYTEEPSARPLVVIDPEDREQAGRLLEAYTDHVKAPYRGEDEPDDWRTDRMQAALREFADPKPPKPAEPTGLGAVVECSDGRVFVVDHVYLGTPRWYGPVSPGGDAYGRPSWADIPAVRVLSEGVPS